MDGGTEAGLAAESQAPQGGIGAITLRRAPVGVEESVVRVYCGISVWACCTGLDLSSSLRRHRLLHAGSASAGQPSSESRTPR
jgi:hypothetical protein